MKRAVKQVPRRKRNQFVVDLGVGEQGANVKAAVVAAAEAAGVSPSEWVRQVIAVGLGQDSFEKRLADVLSRVERLGEDVFRVQQALGMPGP